jgi:hypothetical protein
MVFCNLRREISPLCVYKNICDGVGGQDESNGTHLDPPLFWLDNIFNKCFSKTKANVLIHSTPYLFFC